MPDRLDDLTAGLAASLAAALRPGLERLDAEDSLWLYLVRRLQDVLPPGPPDAAATVVLIPRLIGWRDLPPDFVPDRSHTRQSPRKGRLIMATDLRDDQRFTAEVEFRDRRGNPAPVDAPDWTTDNSELLILEPLPPDADRPNVAACRITPVGPLGTATVTLRADADPGDGVREIVASGELRVVAGSAIQAKMTFGLPEDLPNEEELDPASEEPAAGEPAVEGGEDVTA